uniref:MADF domain-containing protein n=1 Tax=Timema genevievae TaxID=629358 RepID=A0A7R9PKE9_TIMGE|nr:unnamed protein product [Timema genevievae]
MLSAARGDMVLTPRQAGVSGLHFSGQAYLYSNNDMPVTNSPVYCESEALDHSTTERVVIILNATINVLRKETLRCFQWKHSLPVDPDPKTSSQVLLLLWQYCGLTTPRKEQTVLTANVPPPAGKFSRPDCATVTPVHRRLVVECVTNVCYGTFSFWTLSVMNCRTGVHIDEEKLIFLVSNYRELYDLEHKSYSDHEKRDRIWEEIGLEMNVPRHVGDRVREVLGHVGDRVREVLGYVGDRAREMLGHVGDRVREVLGHVGDRAREVLGHVGDRVREVLGYVGDRVREVLANLCREKWNTLRGSYRRSLRSKASWFDVTGTGKKRKKWRFEDEMSFLFDFIQERESLTNFVGDEGASKDAIEFEDEIKQEADTDPLASSEIAKLSAQSETASLQGAPRPKKNPSDDGDKEDGLETTLDGYIRRKSRTMPSDQTTALDDNVTRFFVSMAETVKGFPPLLQAYVKAEVFKSVNMAEVRYLKESQEAQDSYRQAP